MATGKRRQTFEKMNRERKVREKRALKAERREQRKREADLAVQDPALANDDLGEPAQDDSSAEERGFDSPVT